MTKSGDFPESDLIRSVFCLMIVALVAHPAVGQTAPDFSQKQKLLDGIREAALAYDNKLPNFFCTQVTTRENAKGEMEIGARGTLRSDGFQYVDSLEQQLSYFGRHESYKVLKVNGKAPVGAHGAVSGASSTGEFGTMLHNIFDARSHAQLKWNRWGTLRGRPVAVFTFKVEQSNSQYELITPVARAFVGYSGLVFVDRETHTVWRVIADADSPPGFPFQETKLTLDYGVSSIAGERFVLPLRAELECRTTQDFLQSGRLGATSPQILIRNRTEFRKYSRYTADSELKFDPVDK